jgi:type II secretory pathway component GspD/PulD (secretin)
VSRLLSVLAVLTVAAPAVAQESGLEVDERKQQIVNKINNTRVSVDFRDVPLEEAINFLREFTGINIVVDAEVHTRYSEDHLRVTLKVRDLLLKSTLKLVLSLRDLTATYRDGVLMIVPRDKVDKAVTLQIYDVRDLLVQLQDFPGPKVELVSPSGTGGGPLTGATFTLDEPRSTITEDFITEMVKTNTGDRTWDDNPNASMTLTNGRLIVSQSKRVHEEIRQLINLLRQFK